MLGSLVSAFPLLPPSLLRPLLPLMWFGNRFLTVFLSASANKCEPLALRHLIFFISHRLHPKFCFFWLKCFPLSGDFMSACRSLSIFKESLDTSPWFSLSPPFWEKTSFPSELPYHDTYISFRAWQTIHMALLYTMKFTHCKCEIQWFLVNVTEWCNRSHNPVCIYFDLVISTVPSTMINTLLL